jgi:hypothetical protein
MAVKGRLDVALDRAIRNNESVPWLDKDGPFLHIFAVSFLVYENYSFLKICELI